MWENVGIVGFPQAEECELRPHILFSPAIPKIFNTDNSRNIIFV